MAEITEMKKKLDALFSVLRDDKNKFEKKHTQATLQLLIEMLSCPQCSERDIANELGRFPPLICDLFFNYVINNYVFEYEKLEQILKLVALGNSDKVQKNRAIKVTHALESIIIHYPDDTPHSTVLPRIVLTFSDYISSGIKPKERFLSLVEKTDARLYELDYSVLKQDDLRKIWDAALLLYPEMRNPVNGKNVSLPDDPVHQRIRAWAVKYGFLSGQTLPQSTEEKPVQKALPEPADSSEPVIQEPLLAAISELLLPISKAIESVQGEVQKSREIGAENTGLRGKNAELQHQLTEKQTALESAERSLNALRGENADLHKQIEALERSNAELDSKLSEAFTINSRESSLEAEKVRSELQKAFAFLYEDWLEYEFSDASEENYESLQAIIKKMFRSLERNGIHCKGRDE